MSKETKLTKEQIEYRNNILQKFRRVKKDKPKPEPKKLTTMDYIYNCVWWINEYKEGRSDKKRFIEVIESLRHHCVTILNEHR